MKLDRIKRFVTAVCAMATIALGLPAVPAFAATNIISLTPVSQNVAGGVGASFTLNVTANIDPTTPTRGFQFTMNYDQTKVNIDSIAVGSFYTSYGHGTSAIQATLGPINNTTGTTGSWSLALVGGDGTAAGSSGPTGTGTIFTITGHGVALAGTPTNLTLNSVIVSDAGGNAIPGVTLANASLTIGPVTLPDFVVTGASGSPTTSDGKTFNVNFAVVNNGTLNAAPNNTQVTVTGLTPVVVVVPALNIGQTFNGSAGPFTITGSNATVTVVANFDNAVSETSVTNNTFTFTYSPVTSNGTTTINATVGAALKITPPSPVVWSLVVGNNTFDAGNLNVLSNTSWETDIVDNNATTAGHLTELSGSTYLSNKLNQPVNLIQGSTTDVLSTTPQKLATGTIAGQNQSSGQNFDVQLSQVVYYSDPVLPTGETYNATVTFTAFVTA